MDKEINVELFKMCAMYIADEWGMPDLSDGYYYEYALAIAQMYFKVVQDMQPDNDKEENNNV